MVVTQMRFKLMMALTDLKACVCLSAFLQVQLSSLLNFICDCFSVMQHRTLFMTFSRQSIRMVKNLWHYLKAFQFINAIWLVLKTTDSRAIRRQPCNGARMQQQYCWACDCAQHLWSLIHFTSSVYAKFHFRQYFILLSDKWRCISLTTSLSSFAAGMQIIQGQIYMNKPEQTI